MIWIFKVGGYLIKERVGEGLGSIIREMGWILILPVYLMGALYFSVHIRFIVLLVLDNRIVWLLLVFKSVGGRARALVRVVGSIR